MVCPAKAAFTKSAATAATGVNINFTNTSTNANSYQWLVDGVAQATTTNFSYTTTVGGKHPVQLVATNAAFGCQSVFTDTVTYNCSFTTSFTPVQINTNVGDPLVFTSTGAGIVNWSWSVNGVPAGDGTGALVDTFPTQGVYTVRLTADNGVCTSSTVGYVYVGNQCKQPVRKHLPEKVMRMELIRSPGRYPPPAMAAASLPNTISLLTQMFVHTARY